VVCCVPVHNTHDANMHHTIVSMVHTKEKKQCTRKEKARKKHTEALSLASGADPRRAASKKRDNHPRQHGVNNHPSSPHTPPTLTSPIR